MIAPIKDASPWWYSVSVPTNPANWATLISLAFLPRRKDAYRIFLRDGLSPSTIDGIDLILSAFEKCISSLLMKDH